MAYLKTSDSIIVKATLTDKGRRLLSRGKFKIAKFALGDDELDYELLDPKFLDSTLSDSTDYDPAIKNSFMFEAQSAKNKGIQYGLNSYDDGVLYLETDVINDMFPNIHAHILYLPILKTNNKLTVCPTLSGSVYYLSANDETSEKLTTISNFKFLTTNTIENTKIVIESGITDSKSDEGAISSANNLPTTRNRREKIVKKFLLDHDYFIYADNKFFRKVVGINQGSRFENFPSGEVIVNFKTGEEAPTISYESEFDSYATFLSKGIPNLIFRWDSAGPDGAGEKDNDYSVHEGPRGTVIAFNPLIDQELKTTSTGERDFRYSEYGYTDQIVFGELPTTKFDYIDTTIYVMGATTNSRVRVPLRIIRYTGI
jgi:hypothetical protein